MSRKGNCLKIEHKAKNRRIKIDLVTFHKSTADKDAIFRGTTEQSLIVTPISSYNHSIALLCITGVEITIYNKNANH